MRTSWNSDDTEMAFECADMRGVLVADCGQSGPANYRHQIRDLVHKPSATRVSPEGGRMARAGAFTLFRVTARNAWLTELRNIPPTVTRADGSATLTWRPSFEHQVTMTATFTPKEPNIIDVDITAVGHAYYPDYSLLLCNYVSPLLTGRVHVRAASGESEEYDEITPTYSPVFSGMYPFFPRDEYAVHMLTDGRGRRGRWHWDVVCGRHYAYPMALAGNDQAEVVLLGRPEDIAAVGVTYSADGDDPGHVAQKHALYLALFGRDLHPGEGWRTQVRLVVGTPGERAGEAVRHYHQFMHDVGKFERHVDVQPIGSAPDPWSSTGAP